MAAPVTTPSLPTVPPQPTPPPPPQAPCPAWVVVDPTTSPLRVAALPVLDRILIALHRAGCSPITVVGRNPLPPLPRSTAWKVRFASTPNPPSRPDAGIVVGSNTLVETADIRRLAAADQPVRLTSRDGTPLVAGRIAPGAGDPEAALRDLPTLASTGIARLVRNPAEARAATQALWASITSGSDGLVDRVFNRPAGRPLSRLLVHTPVTPNTVSVVSILIGVLAAALFAIGQHGWSIAAALLFQVSAIIDCIDGDIARSVFKESPLGKWLDLVGDQVVHISVFVGIAVGLVRAGHGTEAAWLGLSAAIGAALSFAVVLRGLRLARTRGDEGGRMQRILDAVTNRDFSVLVLALAGFGRLEWFLWMSGIGSHVFWIGLLVLQMRTVSPASTGEAR